MQLGQPHRQQLGLGYWDWYGLLNFTIDRKDLQVIQMQQKTPGAEGYFNILEWRPVGPTPTSTYLGPFEGGEEIKMGPLLGYRILPPSRQLCWSPMRINAQGTWAVCIPAEGSPLSLEKKGWSGPQVRWWVGRGKWRERRESGQGQLLAPAPGRTIWGESSWKSHVHMDVSSLCSPFSGSHTGKPDGHF